MYIDLETLFVIGLPLMIILIGSFERGSKYKRWFKETLKDRDRFYKLKSNKEITEFIVKDAIEIGLYVKNCSSTRQIVDTWVCFHNYHRKTTSDLQGVGVNSFDTNKPRRNNGLWVTLPYNYRCVEIDLKSVSNYYKAK